MPFCVYVVLVGGVSVGVGRVSVDVSWKFMLRGLVCFMCVGVGRNFVRISLTFFAFLSLFVHKSHVTAKVKKVQIKIMEFMLKT